MSAFDKFHRFESDARFPRGKLADILAAYLSDARVARMRDVLAQRTRHVTALLEHFHDDHNIAACARTADSLGLQDLHIVPEHGRTPDLGRAVSMRAERWLTLARHATPEAAASALKAAGYALAVTTLDGPEGHPTTAPLSIDELPLDRPMAIAFGNERSGVTPALAALADYRTVLPMRGFVQSLNVSVAFALMLARLRDRLERDVASEVWALSETERADLLDRWVLGDVSNARAILKELAARGRL